MRNILAFALLMSAFAGEGQVISTFDTDADGWTALNGSVGDPEYFGTGGNSGGYLRVTDGSPANATYFVAPAKFLGNKTTSYAQFLRFDLQVSTGTKASASTGDIHIIGSSLSLYLNLNPLPATLPGWSSYSLKLDETQNWKLNSIVGPNATKQQVKQALASITELRINGEYITDPGDTGGIDNVVLEQRITIAPIITSFSPTAGKAGDVITITGSGLGSTNSENEVYFGSMASQITNASATSLTVILPVGAQYSPITVINKTTGLSKKSLSPFNPIFDGGGRIIPASLKSKIDIPLNATAGNDLTGLSVADIDGDGWNDLLVAESSINSVSIFRNLGTGGELSATSFAAKVSFAGAGNGSGLRIIDLDGDGKQDIAAELSNASFGTFRNTSTPGNLSFEPVELWPGLVGAGSLSAVEDVDGDGLFDFIGQHGSGSVFVDFWIAQNISSPGNIEFGSSVSYFGGATLDAGAGVSTGDLDNDGIPEIIVKHNFGGQFQIIKNNSSPGIISLGTPFPIAQSSNGGIVIADFNLDGKNDLAWKQGFNNDDVHIRLNTNSGGVLAAIDFATEIILDSDLLNYGAISVGDVNGDGKPDILASDSRQIGVFENNFDGGTFTASSFITSHIFEASGTSTYPTGIIPADLNGDQKPDLIVGITNTNPVRILLYENKNIHAPVISVNTVSPLKGPVGSTITITGNNFSTTLTDNIVRIGGVEAMVVAAAPAQLTVSVPAGASYGSVSVSKSGLTSRYRLPFTTTFGPGVTFDATHFAPPVNFTLTNANYDIEVGDLNRDGKPDILAEANGGFVFRNTHTSGAISTASLLPDDTLSVNSFLNPRLEDFDGDGYLDVASVNGLAHKNISSLTEIAHMPAVTTGLGGSIMDMSDFNNDGKIDFAVTVDLSGIGDLVVRENRTITSSNNFTTGTYGFLSQNILFNKTSPNGGVVTEDFDGDGFADIVTSNPGTDNISIYRNLGLPKISNAQFATRVDVAVGDDPYYIYKGDFDADGKLDLLLCHWTGTSTTLLIVLQNTSTTGNISFSRIDLTNPSTATVAHIADLDGDGRPEIITTSEAGNRFTIFKNIHTSGALTAASFAAPFNTTVTAPRGITTADLNLDGKPEIIITRAANLLVVYENLIPSVTIAITQQPPSPYYACEGSTAALSTDANGTTNIAYQWQKFNSGNSLFENLVNNTTYSGVTTKTLSIANVTSAEGGNYRCLIKGDLAADVTTNVPNVVFNNLPSPPNVTNGISCGSGSVTLVASGASAGNYRWYTQSPLAAISGEVNDSYITPSLSTATTYLVSIVDTFCESNKVAVTANIATPPTVPIVTSSTPPVGNKLTVCSSSVLTLSAPTGFSGYMWSNGSSTQQITITGSGLYSVVVTDGFGCSSPSSSALDITVVNAPCTNQPPVISTATVIITIGGEASIDLLSLISDADDNLVLSSLSIIGQSLSGAQASIINSTLILNYSGISFTGTDLITIQVCDIFGECAQQQLEIKVIGELEIYNAVSPNSDQLNDIFKILYIDMLPETKENTVSIYNRWGSKVFEVEDYNNSTNVFRGFNNNGNELPSGTYFYKIVFDSGKKVMSGYVILKR